MIRTSDKIISPSRGTAAEAIAYAESHNAKRMDFTRDVINETYRLCAPDDMPDAAVVISRMADETGGANGTIFVSPIYEERGNVGGLGVTDGGDAGLTFPTPETAARAMVGHMLLYATGDIDRGGLVPANDPRFAAYRKAFGNSAAAETLDDLTGKWFTNPQGAINSAARGNAIFPNVPDQEVPMATVNIVGFGPVEIDVPFTADIVPANMHNQRTGIAMIADRWIQHETGNTSPGANAQSERNYLHGGGGGQKVSYHFAVDDTRIIQLIPVDEVAWHGGDGSGPCNMKGIASELCVGSNLNKAKARSNAEKLAAAITKAMNIPLAKVLQHNVCYGKDCPHFMRAERYWPTFIANVTALRQPTAPVVVVPDPVGDEGTGKESTRIDKNGVEWVYSRRQVTPVRDVQTYKYADPTSGNGPILPKGKKVLAYYATSVIEEGKPVAWLTTRNGWRWRLRDALVG